MNSARPSTATFNLLFVCTGNTCRSPTAAAIARAEIERRGWHNVEVASAGIAATDGATASDAAIRVARTYGLDLGAHSSQSVTPDLLAWADLVLTMSRSHLARLERMGFGEKAALLAEFAATNGGFGDVSDPFGGDDAVYDRTFRELRGLISGALDRIAPILAP